MKDVDKELKARMQSGLLEQYVLGLCTADEKRAIESLTMRDAEVAELVVRMRKALDCYCTSCNKPKVHSIQKAKESTQGEITKAGRKPGKLISMQCGGKSAAKSHFQSIIQRFKGWIREDSDGLQT